MPLAKIQQRIDAKLKMEAETFLAEQGIKPSQAIIMFYKEITKQRGFPFLPSHIPNKETTKSIREARKGVGVQTFKRKEDFFDSLKNL